MTHYSRSEWGARAATPGPGHLERSKVEGFALHWPGMARPLRTVPDVMAALRNWQAYHMDQLGWSDLAYQVIFDQAGNVYRGRGLRTQSGANGDADLNERFLAFLLVLAPGEKPTPALVRRVRKYVRAGRLIYPGADRIVGHGDIRPEPTACPGSIVSRYIDSGTFDPARPFRSNP